MFSAILIVLALSNLAKGSGNCTGSSLACNGDQATCSTVPGCSWSDGERARCEGPGNLCYYSRSQGACTATAGCVWYNEGSYCRRPWDMECALLNQSACTTSSGCLWKAAVGQCSGPSSDQCASKNKEQCNAPESGCQYVTRGGGCEMIGYEECEGLTPSACDGKPGCSMRGNCYVTGCDGLSVEACRGNSNCQYRPYQGKCKDRENVINVCDNLSPTVCGETSGCVYSGDHYACRSSDPEANCNYYRDEDGNEGCDNDTSSPSCQWVLEYAGSCYRSSSVSCWSISNSQSCDSAPNCIWDEQYEGGYCDATDVAESKCVLNSTRTGCAENSPDFCEFYSSGCRRNDGSYSCVSSGGACTSDSSPGCRWVDSSEYCTSSNNIKCYKNAEGTKCEDGSSASCTFTLYPAFCDANRDLICLDNSGSTGCATTSNGCKWVANSGECEDNMTCYRNPTNTDCVSGESDPGCTWKAATSPSCVVSNSEYCFPNANNDGCAEGSSAFGCVWKPDDSSSLVKIPSLLLLVLLVVGLSQTALPLF